MLIFDGPLCLATTGTPTPNRDFSGTGLQVLHDPSSPVQHLHISVAAFSSAGILAVAGWRREHVAPARLVESLVATREDLVGSYLAQYVFAHLENVYFASHWWDGLPPHQQHHMETLAMNANPYYFAPQYINEILVPWKLMRVVDL